MATIAQNLQTARENVAAKIAAISADPKPNYSIDGESYSWADYFDMLTSQLAKIDQLIQSHEGPAEYCLRGIV